jgi:hypothetical protein
LFYPSDLNVVFEQGPITNLDDYSFDYVIEQQDPEPQFIGKNVIALMR